MDNLSMQNQQKLRIIGDFVIHSLTPTPFFSKKVDIFYQ